VNIEIYTRGKEISTKISLGKQNERCHSRDLFVEGKIIFEKILYQYDGRESTGSVWLSIWTICGP